MSVVAVPLDLLARPDALGGQRHGDCLVGRPVLRAGRLVGLDPAPGLGAGHVVLPRLTEVHCHLDKCHTIDRIGATGGDLAAAIAAQAADKAHWSADDIRARALRGLEEYRAAGVGPLRSHVDWGHPPDWSARPRAWPVLAELARGTPGLQLAALVGVDLLAEPGLADQVARDCTAAGGVLGGFVLHHAHRREGLRAAFRAAERHGLALDFHVDEGLADGLDGLSLIAETALETGFQGPVLCGHACSLANLAPEPLARTADRLARAGIAVAVLPATNLYLQDRRPGRSPDRRGLAPLHELRAAGVRVVIGTDNVADAFQPGGRHDPLWSLQIAALACQLDPPFGRWLPLVATEARAALGLQPGCIDDLPAADLLAFPGRSTADLLARSAPPVPLTSLLPKADPCP